MHNVAELSSNRTDWNGVQVETENDKFTVMLVLASSTEPLIWAFHVVWPSNTKKCTKIYNARAGPLY